MEAMCYYIHALTALHAGTGQGVGTIDLPIAREKATGLPIVPGSGIKGVLREEFRPSDLPAADEETAMRLEKEQLRWKTLFGPEAVGAAEGSGFAGALNVQDAQLLCLPVRSVFGVFAWTTCPFVLRRWQRDLAQTSQTSRTHLPEVPSLAADGSSVRIAQGSRLAAANGKVFLEDLDFQSEQKDADKLAEHIAKAVFPNDVFWKGAFKERFVIVPDNVFCFLAETATDVRARIRMEAKTRTVAKGALWHEENLPAESLLWGILGFDRARSAQSDSAKELKQHFRKELLKESELRTQIGGNATVGRGSVRWIPDGLEVEQP